MLLGVSSYRAGFGDVDGRVVFDDGAVSAIDGSVRVDSLRTDSPELTRHLFGPEFFDAGAHPEIQFVATGIEHDGPERLRVAGDLTMRGITNPLVLDAVVDPVRVDPIGIERGRRACDGDGRSSRLGHDLEHPDRSTPRLQSDTPATGSICATPTR